MIGTLLRRLLATLSLAGLCLVATGCAVARAPVGSSLPAGPAMIVVAPDPAPDAESEAYADWAGYLNDFAAEKPAGLAIIRMTPSRWQRLAVAAKEDYATVFVRRDGVAMLHPGKLLDPQIYPAGAAWALGGPAGGLTEMGLKPLPLVRKR